MKNITLNKKGNILFLIVTFGIITLSIFVGIFYNIFISVIIASVYIAFIILIYLSLCKLYKDNEQYINKERDAIKSLGKEHDVYLVSDKDIRNMDKLGGIILSDGVPVRKEEIKVL